MDRLGGLVERGLHPDREPVGGLAARRGRDPRLLAGLRLVVLDEEVAQASQARINRRLDRLGDAGTVALGDLRHGRGGMVRGRHGQEALDLLDRAAHRCDGRGPPVGDALGKGRDVLLDQGRVRGQTGQQALEALGRVARLVLRHLRRPDLRTRHVVQGELVLLGGERLEMVLADERQQVAGDDLLGLEPVGADVLRLGQRGAERGLVGGTAIRAEVGPAVVEALIAEDRGGQRVALENSLPEAVGEVVHGGIGIDGGGHGHGEGLRKMAWALGVVAV